MKCDFIRSGYPATLINTHVIEALKPSLPKQDQQTDPKYILRIPYMNEAHTRVMRRILKECNIDARVVVTAGTALKSLIKPSQDYTCDSRNCTLCLSEFFKILRVMPPLDLTVSSIGGVF